MSYTLRKMYETRLECRWLNEGKECLLEQEGQSRQKRCMDLHGEEGVFSATTDPAGSGSRRRSPTAPYSPSLRHALPHGDYVYLLVKLAGYRDTRALLQAA